MMAIVGGTFSMLGGGKFASGALAGAFVHMFNAEAISFMNKLKRYLRRVERVAQRNKITYKKAYGKIVTAAGSTLSTALSVNNANRLHVGRWGNVNPRYIKVGEAAKIIFKGKSNFPLAAARFTAPAVAGGIGFKVGVEAGHYLTAYFEASWD
jgi:hypothetical protein